MTNSVSIRQISVSEMAPHVHHFLPNENKVDKIFNWLSNWILVSLKKGTIKQNDRLPRKGELAFHIGVSIGTFQSVYRRLEDAGLVFSKQKQGTFIVGTSMNSTKKLTSKKDSAENIVKRYIKDNDYKIGDVIISARKLAEHTGLKFSTLRSAMLGLVFLGILKKQDKKFILESLDFEVQEVIAKNIVIKIADEIKKYISTLNEGDKIPTNKEFALQYNVSLKTINDAMKYLEKDGSVVIRRGNYGTVLPKNDYVDSYLYEVVEDKVKEYIINNGELGAKLPSMSDFAKAFNVSTKTIKKALNNLANDGYVTFTRGHYGGTFITDIPSNPKEAYTWLAINNDYFTEN